MNKPAAVGSVLVLGSAAFVAGRYRGGPNTVQHPSSKRVLYVDRMHPAYHSDKPGIAVDCGMALEPVYEGEDAAAKLQLAPGAVSLSAEKQQLIGTRAKRVAKNSGSRLMRTTGRVEADDNRVYRFMAVTDGRVPSLGDNPAGTEAYKPNLTLKNGQTQHVWVDTKTFLDVKIEGTPRHLEGKYHPVATYLREYKAVNGLMVPYVLETAVEGVSQVERIQIESVAVNPKLDDSLFAKLE